MSLYTPRHFATADHLAIHRVLDEFGFATLITTGAAEEPIFSHVPILFEPGFGANGALIGHVAAANPHAAALTSGKSFLLFQGPSAYVSPNWYSQPAASVPTWNYVAVHAHGPLERIDAAADKRAIVDALSARHESAFPRPWTSSKMDDQMLQKLLTAIVGFRMNVERFDAKFKLTQNRSSSDRAGVIAGLEARGSAPERLLASWMRDYAGE